MSPAHPPACNRATTKGLRPSASDLEARGWSTDWRTTGWDEVLFSTEAVWPDLHRVAAAAHECHIAGDVIGRDEWLLLGAMFCDERMREAAVGSVRWLDWMRRTLRCLQRPEVRWAGFNW